MYYNARYYDPAIGRFVSADTIVPGVGPLTVTPGDAVAAGLWGKAGGGPANPQELNRYAYGLNNPVKYTDPTGHEVNDFVPVGGGYMPPPPRLNLRLPSIHIPSAHEVSGAIVAFIAYLASEAINNAEDASLEAPTDPETTFRPKPDLDNLDKHALNSMRKRGWTKEMIEEAWKNGEAHEAEDVTVAGSANPAPATRYVHPETGASVIVNNETGRVVHVGNPGFNYDKNQ